MAANALIVLTQDGITRPAGDAIHDGVTAKAVTIENDTGGTDVTSWTIEILDVPSGPLPAETSAIPTGILASGGASAPLGNFTPDVPGTYYIRLTINGIEIDEVAVCVPNDQGWVNPAYNAGGDAYNFTGNDRGWAYFFDRILSYMHANLGGGGGITGSGTDNHIMRWDGANDAQDSGLIITDGDDLQGVGDVTFNSTELSISIVGGYPTTDDKAGQDIRIYGGDSSTQTGSTQRKGGDVDVVGGSGPFGGAIAFTIGDGGDVTVEGGYGGFNTDSGGGGDGGNIYVYGGWEGNGTPDGVWGSVYIGTYHTTAVHIADSTSTLGFHDAVPVAKQTVIGAKGGNVALTNLMTALDNLGILTDSTT
jgi:hypothetical protein